MKINEQEIEIYAYLGADEFGSGRVGLKQAFGPNGLANLVVMDFDRHKIDNPQVRDSLEAMARKFGKKIRFCRLVLVEIVAETEAGE